MSSTNGARIELSFEERAQRILELESMRDACIASIEGLRSGNHKIFKKDPHEVAMNEMFAQVEFELKQEEKYRSTLKKLENELREDVKP